MSALQDNDAEAMRQALDRVGLAYRPEDMGVTWDDVAAALRHAPAYADNAGLWHTVLAERPITDDYIDRMRNWLRR
jgi:hypothetical protein